MHLELTEQQRQLIQQSGGKLVEVVDPRTHETYVLIARDQFDREAAVLSKQPQQPLPAPAEIPDGIRRSQQALRRDLPRLLEQKKLRGRWVAYHGDECIGHAPRETTLTRECMRRGFKDDEYYVGWIDATELVEEEQLDSRPWHNGREEPNESSHQQ